jgi:hypothetical protein
VDYEVHTTFDAYSILTGREKNLVNWEYSSATQTELVIRQRLHPMPRGRSFEGSSVLLCSMRKYCAWISG